MISEEWVRYSDGTTNNETLPSSSFGTFSILGNLWNDADFKAMVRNRYSEIAIRGYCVVRQIMSIQSSYGVGTELDKIQVRIVSMFDADSPYFANSSSGNPGFT